MEYKIIKVTFLIITYINKPFKPYNKVYCSLLQNYSLLYQYKIYTILTAKKHLEL